MNISNNPSADPLITGVVQAVAELPDRTSPDDWPEAMLVTADELACILTDALSTLQAEINRLKADINAPKNVLDELHAIFTNHGISSYTDHPTLAGDVVTWATRYLKQYNGAKEQAQDKIKDLEAIIEHYESAHSLPDICCPNKS